MQNTCYMQFKIITEKCTGCGTCTDVCPTEAIQIRDDKAIITIDCVDCGACTRVCPEGAIKKQALSALVQNVK